MMLALIIFILSCIAIVCIMEREDQIFDMVLLNCNYIVMHILPNGAVEILITITVSGLVVVVRVMLSKVDSFFVVFREASR